MAAYEKLIIVTQKTALEECIERYNTLEQARFYVEHMGVDFSSYEKAHQTYHESLAILRQGLPAGVRTQFIDRSFLPTFLFGPNDLIVALGRDGLVVNIAKYLNGQPLIGVNPDTRRNDGVLLPFGVWQAPWALRETLNGQRPVRQVTMARAILNDGQELLAVNDLFIGQQTHTSARYQIEYQDCVEAQSSSGIIVSTGAGSTGWFRSILTGAVGVIEHFHTDQKVTEVRKQYQFDWEARELRFCVREPFISKTSQASILFGPIADGSELVITSQMPQRGVIFSDGIEDDCLEFNTGKIARISIAERTLLLVV